MYNLSMNNLITNSWNNYLSTEYSKEYFINLQSFLLKDSQKYEVFPSTQDRFTAYNLTPLENVKVVILGQDPYHDNNQAHGLSFSVKEGIKLPPSLKNIFKELCDDLGCNLPNSGSLESWAKEGVFLLNTVLSVQAHCAGSHQKKGWEEFTDTTIKIINAKCNNIVFILWGKPAQMKEKFIDDSKHLILKAPHPSPLSSYRGFFGSKPFSKTNRYLSEHKIEPINWCSLLDDSKRC